MDFPAAGEATLATATGIPATIAGGIAGGVTYPFANAYGVLTGKGENYGLETAAKVTEKVAGMGYQPKTEGGQDLLELVAGVTGVTPSQAIGREIGKKAEEEGYPTLGALGDTATQALPVLLGAKKGTAKTATNIDKSLNAVIDEGINKGIKPSVVKKEVRGQVDLYKERTQTAVKEIINNKDSLELVDATGAKVEGLPKTLDQFSQAIDQTKQKVFAEYDALSQNAGNVTLDSVVTELNTLLDNKVLKDLAPETLDYAAKRMEALMDRGTYTATETQEAIQTLNQSLKHYYENPSPAAKGQALVDSMIANKLREQLDLTIEQATGADYQGLKNKYGALRTLEKDVTKRTVVDARRNVKGFYDISDVYTGMHVIKGLLSKDPISALAGVGGWSIKKYIKWMNDPNKIVSDMFSKADSLVEMQKYNEIKSQIKNTNPTEVTIDGKKKILTEENGQLVIK